MNFNPKYIQRHLRICRKNIDLHVNSSYVETASVIDDINEYDNNNINNMVEVEEASDGGCYILSESVFEEEPKDDDNNQDMILSDNEFEELLLDEPREEFNNNSNLLPDPNKLFLLQ